MNRFVLKNLLLACVLLVVMPVSAALKYPCQKELKKKQYDTARQQIERLLAANPSDGAANYAAYILYTDSLWDGFDPKQGYDFLVASQAFLDKDTYNEQCTRVGEMLWNLYARINTLEAYNYFVTNYKKVPLKIRNRATKKIYYIAYNQAVEINTDSIYRAYKTAYTKSPYCKQVDERIVLLKAAAQSDWRTYRDIISTTKFDDVKNDAVQGLYRLLRQTEDVEGLRYGCTLANRTVRDSCLVLLHKQYTETDDITSIQRFAKDIQINGSEVYDILKRTDNEIIEAYNIYSAHRTYANLEQVVYVAAPSYFAFKQLQHLLYENIKAKQWDDAFAEAMKFNSYFAGERRYEALKELLARQVDYTVIPEAFPAAINTPDGDEYVPQLSGDGNTILFCGDGRSDGIGNEDIYMAKRVNGVWQQAEPLKELCTFGNDAPVSLSVDGNSLIIFRNGALCVSKKTAEGWSVPRELPANINFSTWQADARITSDGQALLFAARGLTVRELNLVDIESLPRDERFARTNIFVSLLQPNGTWGKPIDLGKTINTPLCDRAPFLHPDMKTLYFSSEGHGGLGNLDVFRAQRLSEDSWTEWSEPENLGKEINTIGSDCWYIISTDGQMAYYSTRSGDTKQEDIYQLPLPSHFQPDKVATISGQLTDKNGQALDAEIIWEDLSAHQIVGRSRSNPTDGSFFIVLPKGKIYGYYIDKEGFFPIADNIDLREVKGMVEMKQDITVVTYEQMIEEQIPMPLNNLFFPTGQSVLLPESQSELRRIAQIIRELGAKVEISGHTDNVGGDSANQLLSEQRAKATYDFLVAEGCDPALLQWHGYGATKPIATNKTEKGRQQNRRVELRFVK